ncbi:copper resistance protein CopC [Nonomuraea sp. NPDC059194]|uniref:copper resistance CopC family protein n=1 Tax=Nonomuraea sp. NPDC059194 TaxID=3346764 RepID=UPI0036CF3733
MNRSPLAALTALLAALLTGLVAAVVVAAPPAFAHDALKSSDPKKDSTVKTLEQVELEFNATPKLPFVIVRSADGAEVQEGKPEIDGKVVTQRLKGVLPDGGYTIAFRVVSSDGHPIEGEIPFKVKGAPQPTPSEQPASAAPSEEPASAAPQKSATAVAADQPAVQQPAAQPAAQSTPSFPVWLIIVIGALVGIGIGFLLSARKKK